MKKFISLLLAVLITVGTMAVPGFAATTDFVDVDTDNEVLVEAVDLLDYMGVAKGMSDTKFGADELVTREQFALFVYRLMKGGKDAPANASNTTKFTDLENPTYFYAISWANAAGIVNGRTETTFCPKDPITLQEAYAMLTRALEWENEDTVYPYGHIEIAEQKGVELDKGLSATVDYKDLLTRGDMAILLNNAFFSEMGIEKTETVYETLSNGVIAINKKTFHPVLCEEKFGVQELELQAVATPHYTLKDAEATYNLGYDAIYFKGVENNFEAYISAEELGLNSKNLDDYFLGVFTIYAEVEDNEIEKVLFADCNMVKTTTNDMTLGVVSTNKPEDRYEGTDVKLLSGKITFNDTDVYIYDAPYSYAKGNYTTQDKDDMYFVRNKENVEMISFNKESNGDDWYYVADISPVIDEDFSADPVKLLDTFYNVYYDGLYKATFYDVNADGLYDYVNYVPYTLFQVDSDKEEYFDDSDFDLEVPYIYTNEAVVSGARFSDEDYVIGYFNENNETVYVAEVIKPTVSTVKTYKSSKGTITLGNGDVIDAVSAWKYVNNYSSITDELVVDMEDEIAKQVAASPLFTPAVLDSDDEIEFYIYNDVLLYHTEVTEASKFSGNLIIPTDYKEPRFKFDAEAGKDVWYIHAYVDGIAKYVPVETEDVYPTIIVNNDISNAYAEQLCTYTIKNGLYVISSLAHGEDEDGAPDCLSSDIAVLNSEKSADYIAYDKTNVSMTKVAGSRFTLGDEARKVELQNYTNIIIRVPGDKDNEYEYLTYGKSDFTASANTIFDTATYILTNNIDSNTKENLAVLYATVSDDFEFVGKSNRKSYRIVCESEFAIDDDGEFRNFYTLINPFTGEKEYNVPSKHSAKKAKDIVNPVESGLMIKLVDGFVDEDKETAELGDIVWVTEYDDALSLAAITDTACETCIEATADTFVEVDKNTVVMVLKADSEDKLFTDGKLSTVDAKVLKNQKNDYLCSNEVVGRNDTYKTAYAPYVKAYVSYDTDVDEDEAYVADYVIIVVYENDELITNADCEICK